MQYAWVKYWVENETQFQPHPDQVPLIIGIKINRRKRLLQFYYSNDTYGNS